MLYLLLNTNDLNYAKNISKAFWLMARPSNAAVTQYYAPILQKYNATDLAMGFSNTADLKVDPTVAPSAVSALITTITSSESTALQNAITSAIGTFINPLTIMPASLGTVTKTYAELVAANWFPPTS
jgi:hypothetical protein